MSGCAPRGGPRSPYRRAAAAGFLTCLLSGIVGLGCRKIAVPPVRKSEALPGGDTSVSFRPKPSFMLPAANLPQSEKPDFYAGKALAGQPWVQAPSITDARDGLGPLYNARTCFGCHVEGGRGIAPTDDGPLGRATVVRLSVPGADDRRGPVPEPTYGEQLQPQSIALSHQLRNVPGAGGSKPAKIPPEGVATATWVTETFRYPDGREVELREPIVEIVNLGYGALDERVQVGLRHAPPIHGLGLLELVAQSDVDALADPDDRDGDGISGRVNQVWDPVTKTTAPGRFGLKANQPSLFVQVAAALHADLGITSTVFEALPCSPSQTTCAEAPHGAPNRGPEISDSLLSLLVGFSRSIGVPVRRKPDDPMVREGRSRFHEVGCTSCHAPRFVTETDPEAPHLSRQEIWPYTDLLLHDMGERLSDGRPDFLATGSEWRTPPLWGIGLARAVRRQSGLLHDGRARNVEEAVLWHGGEADTSRRRFTELPEPQRRALLAFVRSL